MYVPVRGCACLPRGEAQGKDGGPPLPPLGHFCSHAPWPSDFIPTWLPSMFLVSSGSRVPIGDPPVLASSDCGAQAEKPYLSPLIAPGDGNIEKDQTKP